MKRNQSRPVGRGNDDFHLRALMYLDGEATLESLTELENDIFDPTNAVAFVELCRLRSELREELNFRAQADHLY